MTNRYLVCILANVAIAPALAQAGSPLVISTDHGAVRGAVVGGVEAFLGIPYAAPPVGALRWRAPQPAKTWRGVLPAGQFRPACPQKAGIDSKRIIDESCLFVNVERPVGTRAAAKLPVFVFIHGGGFTGGSGNNENPDKIVRESGIVAVTMNYRLGILGFLAHPALSAEGPQHESGNYGFEDQQAALRWVSANVARFGGDPSRITIAGESAGGNSICAHLVAPGSRGLFSQAVIQSGSCTTQTLAQAERAGVDLANNVMCPDPAAAASCLRSKSVDELFDSPGAPSRFIRGTSALPSDPRAAVAKGEFAHVPLLIGWTRHEGRSFQRLNVGWTRDQYVAQVRAQYGRDADVVLSQYRWPERSTPATAPYLLADIQTDARCINRGLIRDFAKYTTTFAYEFAPPVTGTAWYKIPDYDWGDGHATELPYLFPKRNGGANAAVFDADEQQLARNLVQYWGAFVKTGRPAASGLKSWPTYTPKGELLSLRVAGGTTPITDAEYRQEHQCDFWETLPPQPAT